MTSSDSILDKLTETLLQRKQADVDTSYVASLHRAGLNKILEKLGEEAIETIIAAKDVDVRQDVKQVIHETADLWFHSMVMLNHLDIEVRQVLAELERRFSTSGLVEKVNRSHSLNN